MPEVLQSSLIEPTLQISPRIHSRRSMPLKINEVSRLITIIRPEKMIEPHLQQRSQRRIRRNMPANPGVLLVLSMHHRHRVPSQQRLHPLLQLPVARIRHFIMLRNRVPVRRGHLARRRHPRLASPSPQLTQQLRPLLPVLRNYVVKRLNPLRNLSAKVLLGGFFQFRRHNLREHSSQMDRYAHHRDVQSVTLITI